MVYQKVGNWLGVLTPVEKYESKFGSFPQIGMNIKDYLKPPPRKHPGGPSITLQLCPDPKVEPLHDSSD